MRKRDAKGLKQGLHPAKPPQLGVGFDTSSVLRVGLFRGLLQSRLPSRMRLLAVAVASRNLLESSRSSAGLVMLSSMRRPHVGIT